MSVFRREVKGKDGKIHLTEEFHYKFMYQKKFYFGVCEGCRVKSEAEKFEKKIKETVKKGAEQKTAKALIENFREELTGGIKIPLITAFDEAQKQTITHASEKQIQAKKNIWLDFVAWMKDYNPDKKDLADVTMSDAEKYLAYVAENGRYATTMTYTRGKKQITAKCSGRLGSRTQIFYHTTLKEVFSKLCNTAGLTNNPFNFKKIKLESETREAFTEAEIKLIFKHANPFIEPLFRIAIATALREGDICTLRWDEVDLDEEIITRKMRKTKGTVVIPIAGLASYLRTLPHDAEYVLPEHAKMYLHNPSGVSMRIKDFLEKIGIKTTKKIEGRDREISIKDLHSCRHTFCYNAGLQGIPLSVVQDIVGHMTPEMTAMYSSHATLTDKRNAMNRMHALDNEDRRKMIALAKTLPIKKVQEILRKYTT